MKITKITISHNGLFIVFYRGEDKIGKTYFMPSRYSDLRLRNLLLRMWDNNKLKCFQFDNMPIYEYVLNT